MSDFWSNTIANLIGTFVGAGLALLSAWAIAKRQQALSEIQSLQRLIDRIYRSRAYAAVSVGAAQEAPLDNDQQADFQRTTASVFITRELIDKAASVNPRNKSAATLDDMYVATLYYLNATEVDPRRYVNELMHLREQFISCEKRLKQIHPRLILREPGTSGQFPANGTLNAHYGRPTSWTAVSIIIVGFILGGIAMAAGPIWYLFWISAGVVIIGGVFALSAGIFDDWY